MERRVEEISYSVFQREELSEVDRELLQLSREALKGAYAPYSNFQVGCAILLSNDKIVCGSNQENASFPVGLCAERVTLSSVSSQYPKEKPKKMAIATSKDNEFITAPCGVCRQTLVEYEERFRQNIAILLCKGDSVYVFDSVKSLLPFAFEKTVLNK